METFWYGHSLEALLPWLSGDESGGTAAVQRQQLRLKIHYVAMTRPTHLLCLAMKRSKTEHSPKRLDWLKRGDDGQADTARMETYDRLRRRSV
jgi:DNA helicase-2/ATP-dependent DNA helicase PcrA